MSSVCGAPSGAALGSFGTNMHIRHEAECTEALFDVVDNLVMLDEECAVPGGNDLSQLG